MPDTSTTDLSRLTDPARLGALADSGMADTVPEETFDRLTRLVQRCLRVPVALVSMVEGERQVFKSQQGLEEPWCSIGETPLSHSFCQHVVTRDAPLEVQDAREHPLVRDNEAVADLNVIAYLGTPLRAPGGHVLGSLCAIDGQPRVWTEADRETLDALADEATREIAERTRLRREADALWTALGRSSALLRSLFEAIDRPALVLRTDGTVAEANAAAGLRPGDVVPAELAAALDPDDEPEGWTLLEVPEAGAILALGR